MNILKILNYDITKFIFEAISYKSKSIRDNIFSHTRIRYLNIVLSGKNLNSFMMSYNIIKLLS